MSGVTATVRHTIVVTGGALLTSIDVEFESRDIGCTQGTTLRIPANALTRLEETVHFRPGTRYWETALNVAREVLIEAFTAAMAPTGMNGHGSWLDEEAFFRVFQNSKKIAPWNGEGPDTDSDSDGAS